VEIRRRIADFIAKIGKKNIECGSAFRTQYFSYIVAFSFIGGVTLCVNIITLTPRVDRVE
jgi:hypothetical protein